MKHLLLTLALWQWMLIFNAFGQMTVEINGPTSATINTQILYTVTFYNNGYQINPPTGGTAYWDYSGAMLVYQSNLELRLNFTVTGSQWVYYEYSTYDDYFSDYLYVNVTGNYCNGVTPSALDKSRVGAGSVTLVADTAPSGFSYQWYNSSGTTLLSSSQSYTTPAISSTTTYKLAYKHTSSGCITNKVDVQAIIADHNYVKAYKARTPTTSESTVKTGGNTTSYKQFSYYDGLGRPMQEVRKQASVSGWDLVVPVVYDSYGRQQKDYLPYAKNYGSVSGSFHGSDISDHSSYYSSNFSDSYGYSQKAYEPSPLDRVVKQAAPGYAWRMGSGKETDFEHRPNSVYEEVKIWKVNSSGLPVTNGNYDNYPSGALWATSTTDADGNETIEYHDKQGRLILKKTAIWNPPTIYNNGWFCTYYVYDDIGNLRVVIPPLAIEKLWSNNWGLSTNSALADGLYYRYTYDERNRLIEKRLPGKSWEYMVYDELDRLVARRDGNLGNKWHYTKYDAHNRVVKTGILSDTRSRSTLQTDVNNLGLNAGASNFPSSNGDLLTQFYYDDYSQSTLGAYVKPSGYADATARTQGLMTGKKVKNLVTGSYYETKCFYDDEGREIQSLAQHHLGGTIRNSTKYNFEGQPTDTYTQFSTPGSQTITKHYNYNAAGQLSSITHKIGSGTTKTIASYSYNQVGEQTGKTFSDISVTNDYTYNIRGWLKNINSTSGGTHLFDMSLFYESGATNNYWNGNIGRQTWKGQDNITRRYDYSYDKASRMKEATFTAGSGNYDFRLYDIYYDGNGNLVAMKRNNQRTSTTYSTVDYLTYTYDTYGNQLRQVADNFVGTNFTADDFEERSSTLYTYDGNGNLKSNLDKQISNITYNYLNLPQQVTFTGTIGKIVYTYDAEGNKLKQQVYNNTTLSKTTDYIGELVFENGTLDYLLHEEGRIAYESGQYQYEYFTKDHLGNVRQVLRAPDVSSRMATMEMAVAPEEEMQFEQLSETRQSGAEHNVTPGGNQVVWLNAGRGRSLGPSRSQEVQAGDSVRLSVHGKYRDRRRRKMNPGSFVSSGARERLLTDLGNYSRSGSPNAIAVFNMVDLLMKDLQKREIPEAYMMYALYDSDSVLYKKGKKVLSRNAANQHEELEEELYIEKDGYMETFLVNETEEDVWYDNFRVLSSTALLVQETHYDPWGMVLKGLDYQYGGIKENKYKYNGKELISDLGLGLYDFGARYYDPAIGRWSSVDPLADSFYPYSPYNYALNNPMNMIDPNGMAASPIYDELGNFLGTDDQGLQGDAIVMEASEFSQSMSHDEAVKKDLGEAGLQGENAKSKMEEHFSGLSSRPDYDGHITLGEANEWFRNGNGSPLYVDLSKIDLTPIKTTSFGNKTGKLVYNFATNFAMGDGLVADFNTASVYGTLTLNLVNVHDGAVLIGNAKTSIIDNYGFELRGDGSFRDKLTTVGHRVAGKGAPYDIYGYGRAAIPAGNNTARGFRSFR